jgi:ABC-type nitrate/sulfonate/bicarbonate transport system substrate-binding protein
MRHRARARIEVIRFLILLWGSGLVPGAAAGELESVRIGLTREASAAPLFVAIAAGYFKAEGLDPQVTFLKTDPSVSAAVASGKVDIGMASLSAPFYSYAAVHGLKMIASRSSDQTGFPMYALLGRVRRGEEVGFAMDSPLEEAGFELPVPLAKRGGLSGGTGSAVEAKRAV